jgi:hypothetical protein
VSNPYEPLVSLESQTTFGQIDDHKLAKSRFRRLLLVSIIFGVAWIPITIATQRFLPGPLVAYLDSELERDLSTIEIVFLVLVLLFIAIAIWNLISLLRFRPSSRPVALALTALGLLVGLLSGPVVESPISRIFADASSLLWGAAMAMMYCKPYADCFSSTD